MASALASNEVGPGAQGFRRISNPEMVQGHFCLSALFAEFDAMTWRNASMRGTMLAMSIVSICCGVSVIGEWALGAVRRRCACCFALYRRWLLNVCVCVFPLCCAVSFWKNSRLQQHPASLIAYKT